MERDDVISLQDYLVVLRRQRWVILSTTMLVVVIAVGVSFAQTPLYEGETEIAVEPVRRTQDVSLENLLGPSSNIVETERLVMTSRPVAERVADAVGAESPSLLLEEVRVETISNTRVVRVIVTDPDPARAAQIANAFADAYLDLRRDQGVEELLAARENLEQRAIDLLAEIEELEDASEDDPIGDDEDAGPMSGGDVQREALLVRLSQISAQIAELGDATEAITGGGAVLTPAETPASPVSPRPLRIGALAAVLGLLLGIGLAFLRDHLDDVVRDEDDFKRATGGRPVLGRIPHWDDPDDSNRLVTIVEPSSIASEAYRELSAGVRFLLLADQEEPSFTDSEEAGPAQERLGRSVLLTSAMAGDGKTSSAANLAVAAAGVGLRTVLVDADLRRSTVAQRFGLGRTTGLSDLLLSGNPASEHVVRVGIDRLVVLPAGTLPPNPHELLASPAMRALHRHLLRKADLIIYDTPASLAVPDALELGHLVDLTILVGRAGVTGRRQLAAVIERLEQAGTPVGGTVLNNISAKGEGYYYQYVEVEAKTGRKRGIGSSDKSPEPSTSAVPTFSVRVPPGDTARAGHGSSAGAAAGDDWLDDPSGGDTTAAASEQATDDRADGKPLFGRHQG